MTTKVKEWGNSQGIRISKELLQEAGIRKDDELDIQFVNGGLFLRKTFRHRTLEERAKEYGGKAGPYQEFDWGQPMGREVWEH